MSLHRHGDKLMVVDAGTFEHRGATYTSSWISAGKPTFERLSFDGEELYRSPVRVEVTVSPTGRSVQVHVNGQRVTIPPSDNGRAIAPPKSRGNGSNRAGGES